MSAAPVMLSFWVAMFVPTSLVRIPETVITVAVTPVMRSVPLLALFAALAIVTSWPTANPSARQSPALRVIVDAARLNVIVVAAVPLVDPLIFADTGGGAVVPVRPTSVHGLWVHVFLVAPPAA